MSRSSQSRSEQQLIAQARELMELSRRAMALAQALQALADPSSRDAGAGLDSADDARVQQQVQVHVAAVLDRAEVATRQVMGPRSAAANGNLRARHSSFI